MTYEEALAFMYKTNWKGSRLGLSRMRRLMQLLGNPQEHLKFIHVAGTNGKGSVCALLRAALTAAGYRTGMYISPHLVRDNERMTIDGMEISDEDLIAEAEHVKAASEQMEDAPTVFETITAMGLCYFARKKCDFVVLEVGLGGRIDATNVIPAPEVAVIMNIGLEHTEILGDTKALIAKEKAGIIKAGTCVVSYDNEPEVLEVLREECREKGASLRVADCAGLTVRQRALTGQIFDLGEDKNIKIQLLGEHQLRNAAVALMVLHALQEQGHDISDAAIREGLAAARWDARFEVLSDRPLVIADGAHNPQCVEALADCIRSFLPGQSIVFVMGVLADKDYPYMLELLIPFADLFVCLTPDSPRALAACELAAYLEREKGVRAIACETAPQALKTALSEAQGRPVVACGSLYLMGEIKKALLEEG